MILFVHFLLIRLALSCDCIFQLLAFTVVETSLQGFLLFAHYERTSLWLLLQGSCSVGDRLSSQTFSLCLFFLVTLMHCSLCLLSIFESTLFCSKDSDTFFFLNLFNLTLLICLFFDSLLFKDLESFLLKHGVMLRYFVLLKHGVDFTNLWCLTQFKNSSWDFLRWLAIHATLLFNLCVKLFSAIIFHQLAMLG